LPDGNRTSKGKSIANVLKLSANENVKAILPIEEFREDRFVVLITSKGTIKKTSLDAFSNIRESGIIALTIDFDDSLIDAQLSNGKNDIFVCTRNGMSIRFDEDDVRGMGRTARGVRGISLEEGDIVVGMEVLDKESKHSILIVTAKGFGKRSPAEEYRLQNRGGVGIITQKVTERVGQVVGARYITESVDLMVTTDKGQIIRMPCDQISIIGRVTQGVRVINLNESETVVGITLVPRDDEAGAPTGAIPNGDGNPLH
jgi:DNA gyrase subunit A